MWKSCFPSYLFTVFFTYYFSYLIIAGSIIVAAIRNNIHPFLFESKEFQQASTTISKYLATSLSFTFTPDDIETWKALSNAFNEELKKLESKKRSLDSPTSGPKSKHQKTSTSPNKDEEESEDEDVEEENVRTP